MTPTPIVRPAADRATRSPEFVPSDLLAEHGPAQAWCPHCCTTDDPHDLGSPQVIVHTVIEQAETPPDEWNDDWGPGPRAWIYTLGCGHQLIETE